MGQELELKYALDRRAQFDAVRSGLEAAFPGNWEQVEMESSYFDTADRALGARRWTLRVRRENGVPVLTLKTPGRGRARGEWELPGRALQAVRDLVELGAPAELPELCAGGLELRCSARFRRLRRVGAVLGATMELALDEGVLSGGGVEVPFLELEAELKAGSVQALENWGRQFGQAYGLREETRSKFARAAALAGE